MIDDIHPEDLQGVVDCTLRELCLRGTLNEHFVIQCVEHGIAQVSGHQTLEWIFPAAAIPRLQKAWRLHRDLDLHMSCLALVLDLLEDRDHLLREVAELRRRLAQWEQD